MTVELLIKNKTDILNDNAGMPDEQREGLQEELIDIILRVLKRNPQLHYYQGYHDIVVTFLLVLGERIATPLVEKLSTHHLRLVLYVMLQNAHCLCVHIVFLCSCFVLYYLLIIGFNVTCHTYSVCMGGHLHGKHVNIQYKLLRRVKYTGE